MLLVDWLVMLVCCVQSQDQKETAQDVYEGLLQLEGIDPTLVSSCACMHTCVCVCMCVSVSLVGTAFGLCEKVCMYINICTVLKIQ